MCKTRAYKHSCGHTSIRRLSSCRFTYASPVSNLPLCGSHAFAPVTVAIEKTCQQCHQAAFMRSWHKRLDEAREKYHFARSLSAALARETQSCPDCYDDPWVEHSSFTAGMTSDDLARANEEQERLGEQLEALAAQFERERWSSMSVPRVDAIETRMAKEQRRRQPASPRAIGPSSLRHSVSTDDLPDYEDESSSSVEDDASSSYDSVFSDDASSECADSEPSVSPATPSPFPPTTADGWNWEFIDGAKSCGYSAGWATKKKVEQADIAFGPLEDDHDSMLPSWGIA